MRTWKLLAVAILSATAAAAQTVIPVGPFRSVELHDGGHVLLRHGETQRVTILTGDPRSTRVRVADGQRLVIEHCVPDCSGGERLRIEVITPEIAAVSVSNGGMVQSLDGFRAQAAIETSVEQGGMIDVRSIPADVIDASVQQGGRIFIHPRQALTATVVHGGGITYWGDPRVRRSVRDGGVVAKGRPEDAKKPLPPS